HAERGGAADTLRAEPGAALAAPGAGVAEGLAHPVERRARTALACAAAAGRVRAARLTVGGAWRQLADAPVADARATVARGLAGGVPLHAGRACIHGARAGGGRAGRARAGRARAGRVRGRAGGAGAPGASRARTCAAPHTNGVAAAGGDRT